MVACFSFGSTKAGTYCVFGCDIGLDAADHDDPWARLIHMLRRNRFSESRQADDQLVTTISPLNLFRIA